MREQNDKLQAAFDAITRMREGHKMRIIMVVAILAVLLPLGGCFHHTQAVAVEPLPTTPIK
jgi:hypothetical protein